MIFGMSPELNRALRNVAEREELTKKLAESELQLAASETKRVQVEELQARLVGIQEQLDAAQEKITQQHHIIVGQRNRLEGDAKELDRRANVISLLRAQAECRRLRDLYSAPFSMLSSTEGKVDPSTGEPLRSQTDAEVKASQADANRTVLAIGESALIPPHASRNLRTPIAVIDGVCNNSDHPLYCYVNADGSMTFNTMCATEPEWLVIAPNGQYFRGSGEGLTPWARHAHLYTAAEACDLWESWDFLVPRLKLVRA